MGLKAVQRISKKSSKFGQTSFFFVSVLMFCHARIIINQKLKIWRKKNYDEHERSRGWIKAWAFSGKQPVTVFQSKWIWPLDVGEVDDKVLWRTKSWQSLTFLYNWPFWIVGWIKYISWNQIAWCLDAANLGSVNEFRHHSIQLLSGKFGRSKILLETVGLLWVARMVYDALAVNQMA